MASGIDSDAAYIPAVNFTDASVDPTAPILGHSKLYVKAGGVYVLHHTGAASLVGAAPSLTPNRLGIGDGSGLLAALAVGATGAVPTRQADGTVAEIVPAGGGGGDMSKIAEVVVSGSAAASVTIPSSGTISAAYRHLRLIWQAQGTDAGDQAVRMRFNGDTGANYAYAQHISGGTHTTASPSGQTGGYGGDVAPTGNSDEANVAVIEIPNYRGTFHKFAICQSSRFDSETVAGSMYQEVNTSLWRSTAAITSITLYPEAGNFKVGGVFTLYGIN